MKASVHSTSTRQRTATKSAQEYCGTADAIQTAAIAALSCFSSIRLMFPTSFYGALPRTCLPLCGCEGTGHRIVLRHHSNAVHSPPGHRQHSGRRSYRISVPKQELLSVPTVLFVARYGAFLRGATETATEMPHSILGYCRGAACRRLREGEHTYFGLGNARCPLPRIWHIINPLVSRVAAGPPELHVQWGGNKYAGEKRDKHELTRLCVHTGRSHQLHSLCILAIERILREQPKSGKVVLGFVQERSTLFATTAFIFPSPRQRWPFCFSKKK